MVRKRATGWAAVLAAAGIALGTAGCGSGGDDDGAPKTTATASSTPAAASTTPALAAMSPEDAYAALQQAMTPGCTSVEECQQLMTLRLSAVDDMRDALKVADPAKFAEPIADAERADRLADQFGHDQLGAAGNMQQLMGPIQSVVRWYATNR